MNEQTPNQVIHPTVEAPADQQSTSTELVPVDRPETGDFYELNQDPQGRLSRFAGRIKEIFTSEKAIETAKFAAFIGGRALQGAAEYSGVTDMHPAGVADMVLDEEARAVAKSAAKKGALIGGAQALAEKIK